MALFERSVRVVTAICSANTEGYVLVYRNPEWEPRGFKFVRLGAWGTIRTQRFITDDSTLRNVKEFPATSEVGPVVWDSDGKRWESPEEFCSFVSCVYLPEEWSTAKQEYAEYTTEQKLSVAFTDPDYLAYIASKENAR